VISWFKRSPRPTAQCPWDIFLYIREYEIAEFDPVDVHVVYVGGVVVDHRRIVAACWEFIEKEHETTCWYLKDIDGGFHIVQQHRLSVSITRPAEKPSER
jgi:hypothetical protein